MLNVVNVTHSFTFHINSKNAAFYFIISISHYFLIYQNTNQQTTDRLRQIQFKPQIDTLATLSHILMHARTVS